MSKLRSDTERSLKRHLGAVGMVSLALLFGTGALGTTIELAGAVMATGSLVVKSSVKKVQHQTGGIVKDLLIEEGSHVKQGRSLIALDDTIARATLSALTRELHELQARRGRLEAERDGQAMITFPDDLVAKAGQPEIDKIVEAEIRLFEFRRDARAGRKKQLRQRIEQLGNEIDGIHQQSIAQDKELTIVTQELVGVQDLFNRNLVQLTRLNMLQRDIARAEGTRGQLTSRAAETRGKIAETELQIIQVDDDMHSEVSGQLGEVHAKMADVVKQQISALDQLHHLEIRAPQDGIVHELTVHSRGAVIAAGEQVMLIVPDSDELVVEVRVAPQDIDKVVLGQKAMLRFPSFDQRTTPEVAARVSRIAADTTQDGRTGLPYYSVQIGMDRAPSTFPSKLRSGMPVDAFIETGERTMLSYLIKPLADQVRRSFREK
jgi:HlyD family secretion protein